MRRADSLFARRVPVALATTLLIAFSAGCSGATIVPAGSGGPPAQRATTPADEFEEPSGPPPGHWTGTITVRGVIAIDRTKDGSSGDPGSTYYETFTQHEVTQTDATDTYTINTADDGDLTYGIHEVTLDGTAANAGSTLESYVTTYQKANSGCTWTEDDGTETKGSWAQTGGVVGSVRFSDDGSYSIEVRPDTTGPDGYQLEGPQLPYRSFQIVTNLSAGCQGNGYDTTTTQAPIFDWPSTFLGEADVNNVYSRIKGQLPAGTPGSTVDGSINWELGSPEGMKLIIGWHLVHDSPIVLPHD
jgi:hypothetical protein